MFLTCSNSFEEGGQPKWGPQGSILWSGTWPNAQQDQVCPHWIPGLSSWAAKSVTAQVQVDEGRGGLQNRRNGLAKTKHDQSPVWELFWTTRGWYWNRDGHPVSTETRRFKGYNSGNDSVQPWFFHSSNLLAQHFDVQHKHVDMFYSQLPKTVTST